MNPNPAAIRAQVLDENRSPNNLEQGFGPHYTTLTYQNLLFCRVPINPIIGFIIRNYKKVGFASLTYKYVKVIR